MDCHKEKLFQIGLEWKVHAKSQEATGTILKDGIKISKKNSTEVRMLIQDIGRQSTGKSQVPVGTC